MPKTLFRYLLLSCFVFFWSCLHAEFVIHTSTVSIIEVTEQMRNLRGFVYPHKVRPENRPATIWPPNALTRYLLQQIQHHRYQQSLDSLIVDTTLCRAAAFHNQEMLDYSYRSTDFQKDGFPFQGMLLYQGIIEDYTSYSFVLETASLAEMEQQFFAHDSLRQILQNPQVNCIGLAIYKTKEGYLCTVYLSERYVFIEGMSCFAGPKRTVRSYYGTTSLSSFTVKTYYHPFHPKKTLRIEDINISSPVQQINATIEKDGAFGFNIRRVLGPSQVLVYYDEQNRPVALGYLHGQVQKKYYIDEDETKHYLNEEE